ADYYNTCKKMGAKRALVSATLNATACSDVYTQDVYEAPELYGGKPKEESPLESQPGEEKLSTQDLEKRHEIGDWLIQITGDIESAKVILSELCSGKTELHNLNKEEINNIHKEVKILLKKKNKEPDKEPEPPPKNKQNNGKVDENLANENQTGAIYSISKTEYNLNHDEALKMASLIVKRELNSLKELSKQEASWIIETLNHSETTNGFLKELSKK
ncbi:unnamed protein product, partial [marine sediment metagenome]